MFIKIHLLYLAWAFALKRDFDFLIFLYISKNNFGWGVSHD